jgi:UDP-3-O-acyl N-acetylglucosamine deacetylase
MTQGTQHTLAGTIHFEGKGLHTGVFAKLTLKPAAVGSGIVFVRPDLPGSPHLAARASKVAATERGTVLSEGEASAATIEHLLGALYGLGVDNCECHLEGPEVPIMDGSADPFVQGILSTGLRGQGAERHVLCVRQPLELVEGAKRIKALPHEGLIVHFLVDYGHAHLGRMEHTLVLDPQAFAQSIAPARTFCFEHEIEAMRAHGLARGGDLSNALVVGDAGLLNPPLRFDNEFVRHKILDFLGDLSLAGAAVRGEFFIEKSGHSFNVKLVRSFFSE